MTTKLILKKTTIEGEENAYEVIDNKGRVVGFVASTLKPYVSSTSGKIKNANAKWWGFALVASEFKSGLQYIDSSRKDAVNRLVKMRLIQADTKSLKVIK